MKRIVLGSILLCLCACGDSSPTARFEPLANDAVVLAFGDSLTRGTGARKEQSYPAVLQGLISRTVVNAGSPGEVSTDGLQRLPDLLEQHQPDLLILCHGGNDILRRQNLANTERNVKRMIELAQARDIEVLLLGVPKFGLAPDTAEFYRTVARATGSGYLHNLIRDVLTDNKLKSDTVHPNAEGYRVMAETIAATLRDGGAL